MGAAGLARALPLARHLECAKIAQYLDGASEIQNVVIARQLGGAGEWGAAQFCRRPLSVALLLTGRRRPGPCALANPLAAACEREARHECHLRLALSRRQPREFLTRDAQRLFYRRVATMRDQVQ